MKTPTEPKLRDEIRSRLITHVQEDENGCWIWQRSKDKDGYGDMTFKQKAYKPHRVSYEVFIESIPSKLQVCHKCDVKACCNPLHLFVGTQSDNMKDLWRKGLGPKSLLTGNSKLTAEDVHWIRGIYTGGYYTQKEIGDMFSVHPSTIGRIVNGKSTHFLEK